MLVCGAGRYDFGGFGFPQRACARDVACLGQAGGGNSVAEALYCPDWASSVSLLRMSVIEGGAGHHGQVSCFRQRAAKLLSA